MNDEIADETYDRFAGVLGDALSVAANESLVLARMEEFFDPRPATLVNDDNKKEVQQRVDRLIEKLGGPPKLIILGNEDARPKYDMYPSAAFSEMIKVFYRARRSVTRAQMFLIGSHLLKEHPEFLELPSGQEFAPLLQSNVEEVFWEHVETAFIRLSSYWDRVGQVLDFVFFGIRHFEREGFKAVIDRIHNNICPVSQNIKNLESWENIWGFQTDKSEAGYEWLSRRRNLIIHSLHLRPFDKSAEENELFESAYNHIDVKFKNKLKPGEPNEEIGKLNIHLGIAAKSFYDVVSLIECHVELGKG